AGSTVVVSGSGVTAGSLVVVSATQITATLWIAANAAPGPRTVTVTSAGLTSSVQTFTVDPAPVPALTSVAPNSGTQGSSVPVTLAGTNFMAGSTVAVSGSGVTAGSVVVASATQIAATLTIAANAAAGPRTVTVTSAGRTTSGQ